MSRIFNHPNHERSLKMSKKHWLLEAVPCLYRLCAPSKGAINVVPIRPHVRMVKTVTPQNPGCATGPGKRTERRVALPSELLLVLFDLESTLRPMNSALTG